MLSQNITNINVGDFFPRLEFLEKLVIRKSHIAVLQPRCFESLPSVTELDLLGNNIRRLGAEVFMGLDMLQVLNLQENEIYHADDAAFSGLPRLRTLFLSKNCLSSIPNLPAESNTSTSIGLKLSDNAITSISSVEELGKILWLDLEGNKIQCDCTMRQVKKYILQNRHLRLYVPCWVGAPRLIMKRTYLSMYKEIRYVDWDDLRCSSPNVSVTLDNETVNITGNLSFTCQTNCREGLSFWWITPSGDYKPPSYMYSNNYTLEKKWSCKGSPVTRLETKRMCFSVLNIPVVSTGTEGTYTCHVTANHTDNASASVVLDAREVHSATTVKQNMERSTTTYPSGLKTTVRHVTLQGEDKSIGTESTPHSSPGLTTTQLIIAGLSPICVCSIIMVGVIIKAACGQRNAADGNHDIEDTNRDTESKGKKADEAKEDHYENDDQFSDADGAKGAHYENNDQFSDTKEAKAGHYENDDQFSDAGEATAGHYENSDQVFDMDRSTGNHYMNDDQFLDKDVAKEGHYENNDLFSDAGEAAAGHYENDDELS
ncbi:corticospinal neuron axon guidance through spinal cord [Branchiostoma belcheri]|nr:corticospinal neuron axon guidance through spinal cord [Branchiostoma belcheri]